MTSSPHPLFDSLTTDGHGFFVDGPGVSRLLEAVAALVLERQRSGDGSVESPVGLFDKTTWDADACAAEVARRFNRRRDGFAACSGRRPVPAGGGGTEAYVRVVWRV